MLADVGTYHAATCLRAAHGAPAAEVRAFMQFNGRLSGGTMATGLLMDEGDDALQACRKDPFALGGAPPGGARARDADPVAAEYDAPLGCWTAPFWMADIDSRVVRRSSALHREALTARASGEGGGGEGDGALYDAHFAYRERALAADEGVATNLASPTPTVARRRAMMARGKLPSPGQGPSAEVRAKSWFRLFFWAQAPPAAGGSGVGGGDGGGAGGGAVLTAVEGGDPGYEETSKMCAEAAILLATRRDELPAARWSRQVAGGAAGRGGVLTPAFALGAPLIAELGARGLRFEELAIVAASDGPVPPRGDCQSHVSVDAAAETMRTLAAQPRRVSAEHGAQTE